MDVSHPTDQDEGRPRGFLFRVLFWVMVLFVGFLLAAFFLVRSESYQAGGRERDEVRFSFEKGTDAFALASDLKSAGIIRSEYAFLYRLWDGKSWKTLQAGEYLLSGTMTIPEIIGKISRGETIQKGVKVTFPEGWTAAEMALRLSENGLPGGEAFLGLVMKPKPEWRAEYPFLAVAPEGSSLEGFLFPDTYFFSREFGAEAIVRKMLENFGKKSPIRFDTGSEEGVGATDADPYAKLILASLIEAEVRTESDRKMVADLFLRRIAAGMPLQSDATVKYALGETKIQHSLDDIAIDSPYNTYKYPGLPPGPIGNPGIVSMRAAISPSANPYWYFLNNPGTGVTVFSTTFEEHVANKAKNGL